MHQQGPSDSNTGIAQAFTDPIDRPVGVFGDQWLGIGCGMLQGRQVLNGADVSERDTDVSKKTAPFDSFDWRIAK